MTDTQNPEEIPTIAGKQPDMTQNSDKIALLDRPGRRDPNSDHVKSYTNIMTILNTNELNSSNAVESYTKDLTPPSNTKQNFSQIVHPNNTKKTMNIGQRYKTPLASAKDPPKVTGSARRKSTKTSADGSGSELKAPPTLSRTSKTNAFSTSTSEKQKRIRSPTKSPEKKTKQKRSAATPMDEDSPNTWKTVMSKSAKVAGYVAKQLIQGKESDDVWSSDEESSDEEVKFVKKKLFKSKSPLDDDQVEDSDDSVQILGVKTPDKTNYYANLSASKEDYGTDDDEDDEDEDDDDDDSSKSSYKDALLNFKSKNNEDLDDVFTSDEEEEEEEPPSSSSFSDDDMSSNASSRSNKKPQKKNKNNKNSRGYKAGGKKGSPKKPTKNTDEPKKPASAKTVTAEASLYQSPYATHTFRCTETVCST